MNIPRLLTPNEVSEILGVSVQTLAVWRCTKRYGLKFVKAGRLAMYLESDLQAFIDSRTHGG
jgi:hypothetical protein